MEKTSKIQSPWIETSRKASCFVSKSIPQGVGWCVLALGSLARYELTEKSDLDILVITSNQEDTRGISPWIHHLMDHHPNIGAVVRSKEECLDMLHEDFRSWVGIIEARPLGGNVQRWYSLRKAISRQIKEIPQALWREKLRESIENRHERYGKSVRLLEPNIKNSAGGLRDIHTIFWLTLLDAYNEITKSCPEFTPRFSTVLKRSPLHERRQRIVSRARDFYLRVRYTMHHLTGMLQDYLDYDLQQHVAFELGYGSLQTKEAVERFMREYLRNAREVHLALEKLFPPAAEKRSMVIPIHGIKEEEGILHVKESHVRIDNSLIAAVFDFAQGQPGVIGEDITKKIDMEVTQKTIVPDRYSNKFLSELFTSPRRIAEVLIHLNNKNILGSWIPEFGRLISFFQHNVYHYYTADEHTLLALRACEELEEKEGYIADVYRRLEEKAVIKLGIFFHDIAKPSSIADHGRKGVEIVHRVLPRLGLGRYARDAAFIVQNHLLMEQVAFRRNFHDERTLRDFIAIVETPKKLDWLILMTYADLCAVNPKVWTPWKEQLLCELHALALRRMNRRGEDEPNKWLKEPEDVEEGEKTEKQQRVLDNGERINFIFHHDSSYSKVTVLMKDRPSLLSSICAALTYQDCNIIDAKIETTADGMAEDTFRVVDIVGEGPLREEQVNGIMDTLENVLLGREDASDLILKHQEKWKRRLRKANNLSVRIDVEFYEQETDTGTGTIVEVYSHDTVGLLYTIARILSDFDLNITVAKIATRIDGVVDSFYVKDRSGRPLSATVKRKLKKALLESIKEMNIIDETG